MTSKDVQSLTKLADAAFQQAAKKVVELAQRFGTPLIVREPVPTNEGKSHSTPKKKAATNKKKPRVRNQSAEQ